MYSSPPPNPVSYSGLYSYESIFATVNTNMKVFMVTFFLIISFLSQYWGKSYLIKTKDETVPQRYEPEAGWDYGDDDEALAEEYNEIKNVLPSLDKNGKRNLLFKLIDDYEQEAVDYQEDTITPIIKKHAPALCLFGIELVKEIFKLKDILDDVNVEKLCSAAGEVVQVGSNAIKSFLNPDRNAGQEGFEGAEGAPEARNGGLEPPPPPGARGGQPGQPGA